MLHHRGCLFHVPQSLNGLVTISLMKNKTKAASTSLAALQGQLQQALALHQSGRLAEAEVLYSSILAQQPKHVDALHFMGILAAQTQRAEMGVQLIEKAIAINPFQAAFFSNLGNSLMTLSRFEEAVKAYAKAISLKPGFEQAHCNLGNAYKALHRFPEATKAFQDALRIQPQMPEARANLGHTLSALGQDAQALEHFRSAIAMRPGFAQAYLGLSHSLHNLRRNTEALDAVRQAVALAPDLPETHEHLGFVLREHGHLNESCNSLRHALTLAPERATTWNSLGISYYELGDLPAALSCYRKAIEVDPACLHAQTNLLFGLSISPDCSAQAYLAEARRYETLLRSRVTPMPATAVPTAPDTATLRIGFVSGDLKHHPVGFFMEGLLEHLDKSKVELVAYVTQPQEDELTLRLKSHFKVWRQVHDVSAHDAAQRIRNDDVHVLVDLAGHTGDSRLEIFAWQPAPVQMSWLGFFASTGVPGMGWLLADPIAVPEGTESQFTEQIARLPSTRLCFTPPRSAPEVSGLPALRKGHVTFGSFQPLVKLHDGVFALWARVLQAVPGSMLRLQNRALSQKGYQDQLLSRLEQIGIRADQVQLCAPTAHAAYLQAHAEVDIILDSFPFNGGTTTCDALWMGVPTLTLQGNTMASRQGQAILSSSGLADWVADTPDAFVALASRKAADLPALSALRAQMRDRLVQTPMFDAQSFASDWLSTVQGIWATHCAAHQPKA